MTIHKPYLVVFSNMADLEFYQDDSDENADDGYGFDRGIGDIVDLTPLQKLDKYLVSDNMFNRQMLARGLLDTLRAVHDQDDDCMAVLDSMAKLSEDPEPSVRSELMEQVPHIAVYCQEYKEAFASAVPRYILPMVVRYLNDSNSQVRKTSQAALLVLMEQSLVEKFDVENQVVKVILELAAPESSDDYRSEAAALMSKMAPLLGKSITERHFLPRFSEMCTDPLFHVRKVCAANFGEVSSVVGIRNCEEVLLPKFFCLCEDGVWGVRKACAECFMTVSCACSLETRRNELANLFVNLLCDQSRWVRMSAFQHLGPFISTFADSDETGYYVNENGNLTVESLESFSLDDFGSPAHQGSTEEDQNDLQGILQLKSLDSPDSPTELDTDSGSLPHNVDYGDHEAMEIIEDELSQDESDRTEFPETSLEELRALSLSLKNGSGDFLNTEDSIASSASSTGQLGDTGVAFNSVCDTDSQEEVDPSSHQPSRDRGDSAVIDTKSDSSDNVMSVPDNHVLDNRDYRYPGTSSNDTQLEENCHAQTSTNLDCTNSNTTTTNTVIPKASDTSEAVPTQDDNTFNHFQYWRSPLPEVDINFDIINSKPLDIHAVSKVKDDDSCDIKPDSNVNISSSSHSTIELQSTILDHPLSLLSSSGSNSLNTILTASVNTMNDNAEETMNIGSTHVLGQHFGERHMAVVDGIVEDLGNNISFMEDLPSLLDMVLDDATLAQQQNIVPQLLLENYLGMVDPTRAQTVDGDITRHCAYNLPAVAYTLGRRNWHCIKQLYETLAQDMQWKVRRTLAFSIHELALIVGDEITHKDLVPIFDGFLKDLDEVRIGVLKHLAEIFKILRPSVRMVYLSRVQDFMKTDNTRNWRFREELAEQLIRICDLFHCREVVAHIVPLSQVLCMDKVAQVRTMSLRLLSSILRRTQFDDERKLLASICNDLIEKFATNNRWLGRQTFAQLSYVILEEDSLPPEVFARNLLPSLLALSADPVANVRLCLARVLSERITPLDYFTSHSNPHHSDLVETLHKLTMDVDKDVRYFSSQQSKTDLSQHHQTVPV